MPFALLMMILVSPLFAERSWERIQDKLPFSFRSEAKLIRFKDQLIIYGGKAPGGVWTSPNGLNWTAAEIELSKDGEAEALVTDSHLWILDFWAEKPRAWYSANGRAFRSVEVEGVSRRSHYCALNYDNRLFIIGGWSDYRPTNDILVSSDGTHWEIHPTGLRFTPRLSPLCRVKNGQIFLASGRNLKETFYDVWSSHDLTQWKQETFTIGLEMRAQTLEILPDLENLALITSDESFESPDGYRWLRLPFPPRPLSTQSASAILGDYLYSLITQFSPPRQSVYRLPRKALSFSDGTELPKTE